MVLRPKPSQIYTHRAYLSCLSLFHSWEPSPNGMKQRTQGLTEPTEELGRSQVPFGEFSALFEQAVIKCWHVMRAGQAYGSGSRAAC